MLVVACDHTEDTQHALFQHLEKAPQEGIIFFHTVFGSILSRIADSHLEWLVRVLPSEVMQLYKETDVGKDGINALLCFLK